jgi:hypothetical protein
VAESSRGVAALLLSGVAIGSAFWVMAWRELPPGGSAFVTAVGVASAAYLAAVARLAEDAALSRRVLLICLLLALAWRVPLVALPYAWSSDAVRASRRTRATVIRLTLAHRKGTLRGRAAVTARLFPAGWVLVWPSSPGRAATNWSW